MAIPSSEWMEKTVTQRERLAAVESPQKIPDLQEEEITHKHREGKGKWELIREVKVMLRSMNDGEISSSAYDTAWVAMVPNLDGDGGPQFPSTLRWIIENQLDDGSWGDEKFFSAHDRIINTLASVVALSSWSLSPEQCERGLLFLRDNMWRLGEENRVELMTLGFEMVLPPLIDIAKGLGLDFPYEDPALLDIYAKREMKMKRIPREVMHSVQTSMLFSLEGMGGLEWEKLLRLQNLDGSFFFSPASTAFALMETRDENCRSYLSKLVDRFHGGVPNVYPVDIFERLWSVDRLQRLGISHHFQAEIQVLMDYVFKYWGEKGLCWAGNGNSNVHDIDDTALGFLLLRLHGHTVSCDVFEKMERDGELFGFLGQSSQAVTGTLNLYKASQLMFSGEEILDQAKSFSYRFLREKHDSNQLLDKWVIAKDLPGEVAYALDFPFYASLPRVEARSYIEQYGGGDDIWIGKTLYRMLYVNNVAYLDLAKVDFNHCQSIHQLEWLDIQRWYETCRLKKYGMVKEDMLKTYFLAAASIFEPDRAEERLNWARTAMLAKAFITSFYHCSTTSKVKLSFTEDFSINRQNLWSELNQRGEESVDCILGLLGFLQETPEIYGSLRTAWMEWLLKLEGQDQEREWLVQGPTALLLIRTIELCAGRSEPKGEVARMEYACLSRLANSICNRLQFCSWVTEGNMIQKCSDRHIESEMQELVKCVTELHQSPSSLNRETKQTFLAVVRSFYYLAWCPSTTLNNHISKVLFKPVA